MHTFWQSIKQRKHVYTSTNQNNNRPFKVLIRMNSQDILSTVELMRSWQNAIKQKQKNNLTSTHRCHLVLLLHYQFGVTTQWRCWRCPSRIRWKLHKIWQLRQLRFYIPIRCLIFTFTFSSLSLNRSINFGQACKK